MKHEIVFQTFFNQANLMTNKNVLVVCDRGIMDPSAYMPADGWQRLLSELGLKQFDLLNKRYDQVYHIYIYIFVISLRVIFSRNLK